MSKKKVLLISYTFPPIPYGGTYRSFRICRGFDKRSIECHVLTLKEYSDIPNDYELLKKVPDSVTVHRVPIIDPWRKYQSIKQKHTEKKGFKLFNKIISFSMRFITFPDHMIFWVPFAVYAAYKLIKRHGIKTVFVSSPPDSSQLIGLILKKITEIRWVADFRDPIYGNVANVSVINPDNSLDKINKKLLLKYDRLISKNADILIANTKTHAKYLKENYECNNVQAIRNSYDIDDFKNVTKEKFNYLTIAHVGSIYGKRIPDLLFSAIKQLEMENAPKKLKLRIHFIGLGSKSLFKKIDRFGIQEYVKITDQLPHHEAIRSMCSAHLLLLIKATGKWSEGQIPGKFYEYVGSRNPLLCIGPKNSEVATLINDFNLGYVVENDLTEMVSILRETYAQYLESGTLPILSKAQVSPFSSTEMVDKISMVIG